DCFEKNDHVMPTCFLEHAQPLRYARTSRRDDRRLDLETGIVIKTVSQTQPRAGSVTVFNDTKYFHSIGCEESLFLQLPCLPFQRSRSRSSRTTATARLAVRCLVALRVSAWRRPAIETARGAASQ